jgi:hypothetical protein
VLTATRTAKGDAHDHDPDCLCACHVNGWPLRRRGGRPGPEKEQQEIAALLTPLEKDIVER